MKECVTCRKLTNNYSPDKRRVEGHQSSCKKCVTKRQKEISRTKKGLVAKIYNSQKTNSRNRGHLTPTYTQQELQEWLFNKKKFHILYKDWKISKYDTLLIPSVDRLNDYEGYSLVNIQITTWEKNKKKGNKFRKNGKNNKGNRTVVQYDLNGNLIKIYHSMMEASRQTGVSNSNIQKCCIGNKNYSHAGKFIWKYKK